MVKQIDFYKVTENKKVKISFHLEGKYYRKVGKIKKDFVVEKYYVELVNPITNKHGYNYKYIWDYQIRSHQLL
jgi:hypothetical protein